MCSVALTKAIHEVVTFKTTVSLNHHLTWFQQPMHLLHFMKGDSSRVHLPHLLTLHHHPSNMWILTLNPLTRRHSLPLIQLLPHTLQTTLPLDLARRILPRRSLILRPANPRCLPICIKHIHTPAPLAMATKTGETTLGTLALVMKQNRTIPLLRPE